MPMLLPIIIITIIHTYRVPSMACLYINKVDQAGELLPFIQTNNDQM